MKTTYTRTLLIPDLKDVEVRIYINNKVKYDRDSDEVGLIKFIGLKSWTIYSQEDAVELEKVLADEIGIDDYHEYLELELLDGSKQYYKNSYVDLFLV